MAMADDPAPDTKVRHPAAYDRKPSSFDGSTAPDSIRLLSGPDRGPISPSGPIEGQFRCTKRRFQDYDGLPDAAPKSVRTQSVQEGHHQVPVLHHSPYALGYNASTQLRGPVSGPGTMDMHGAGRVTVPNPWPWVIQESSTPVPYHAAPECLPSTEQFSSPLSFALGISRPANSFPPMISDFERAASQISSSVGTDNAKLPPGLSYHLQPNGLEYDGLPACDPTWAPQVFPHPPVLYGCHQVSPSSPLSSPSVQDSPQLLSPDTLPYTQGIYPLGITSNGVPSTGFVGAWVTPKLAFSQASGTTSSMPPGGYNQSNHPLPIWRSTTPIKDKSPSTPDSEDHQPTFPDIQLNDPLPKMEPSDSSDAEEEAPALIPVPSHNSTPEVVAQEVPPLANSPIELPSGKRRGRIGDEERKGISATRKRGACMRCHIQRAKCEPNPVNPLAPCLTCLNVDKRSRKTIHHLPCLRFKLATVKCHRTIDAGLTKRFTNTKVVDVESFGPVLTIQVAGDWCMTPLVLEVREFTPQEGDRLGRWYKDSKGVLQNVQRSAFCLADVEKTARQYLHFIDTNVFDGLAEAGKREHQVIKDTFIMAGDHSLTIPDKSTVLRKGKVEVVDNTEQKKLMALAIRLWFAVRNSNGSAYLCGEQDLGIEPVTDVDCDWRDQGRCVPRMVVAQFDSIRLERVYKHSVPKFLKMYEKVLNSCHMNAWFTIYLVTFLFLDLVGVACGNRLRWRRQQGYALESRYGPLNHELTAFIEEVQAGGVVLLAHWHYYKRVDLLHVDWDNLEQSPLKTLTHEQAQFMKGTVSELKLISNSIPKTPSEGCWEDTLFWFYQMFESPPSDEYTWVPPETFTRAKPSVGRDTA